MKVVVQKSKGAFYSVNFASNEAFEEVVDRSFENGAAKNCRNCILDIIVERVNRVVQCRSGTVDPPEQAVVDCRLHAIDTTVDFIGVKARLVVHALIDCSGNGCGIIRSGGSCVVLILRNKGA